MKEDYTMREKIAFPSIDQNSRVCNVMPIGCRRQEVSNCNDVKQLKLSKGSKYDMNGPIENGAQAAILESALPTV